MTYIAIAGSGATPLVVTATGGSGTTITLNRVGTWRVSVINQTATVTQGTGGVPQYNVNVGGSAGLSYAVNIKPGSTSLNTAFNTHFGYAGTVTVGNATSTVSVTNDTGFACTYNPNNGHVVTGVFVPTPAYG